MGFFACSYPVGIADVVPPDGGSGEAAPGNGGICRQAGPGSGRADYWEGRGDKPRLLVFRTRGKWLFEHNVSGGRK